MTSNEVIDYGKLVDDAMHVIVFKTLEYVEKNGLPGDHHFFISFLTQHPQTKISKSLIEKYPQEMTIVLQYQFQGLKVEPGGFSVTLSFSGDKESIYIPFVAITTFADPSVQFGLQFREVSVDNEEINIELLDDIIEKVSRESDLSSSKSNNTQKNGPGNAVSKKSKSPKAPQKVVSLDEFRKKKNRKS